MSRTGYKSRPCGFLPAQILQPRTAQLGNVNKMLTASLYYDWLIGVQKDKIDWLYFYY